MSWYLLSVAVLVLFGLQKFLYKVSAERDYNTAVTTLSFMGTVAFLSISAFLFVEGAISDLGFLLSISALNAVIFLTTTISRIEALKHVPVSVAYPIIRSKIVPVILFGVLWFGEAISPMQSIGILLALAIPLILRKESGSETPNGASRKGLALVGLALVAGAGASIISKFAAVSVNKLAFIGVSYTLNTAVALGISDRFEPDGASGRSRDALLLGGVIGVLNFSGFYLLLEALSTGPLSLISTITNLSFVLPIALSIGIYGEDLSSKRVLGILLAVAAVAVIRLG